MHNLKRCKGKTTPSRRAFASLFFGFLLGRNKFRSALALRNRPSNDSGDSVPRFVSRSRSALIEGGAMNTNLVSRYDRSIIPSAIFRVGTPGK